LKLKNPDLFRQRAFIDGEWCLADNEDTLTVVNPSTGATLGCLVPGSNGLDRH